MVLALYNPLREKDVFDGEQTESYGQSDRSASLRVEGQRGGGGDGGTTTPLRRAGHVLRLGRRRRPGDNPEADQFDTLIDLQVTGKVIPTPTPTATPRPAKTADPGRRPGSAGATAAAARASSGWRSCSGSRSAGSSASASGGCGR